MFCLKFGFSVFITLLLATIACAFESIFEDEDIEKQALPPLPFQGITVPGTKWCGPGDTAANYDDLGTQRETDKCCRAHDHCEEILEPRQTFNGLTNTGIFCMLKCTCEQTFINCLQAVNDAMSSTMGRVYFGARKKCFANGHPIIRCNEYQHGTFQKRCIRYEVDENQPKKWQFYDMPFYSYKP